jgi:hypothetical protein
MNLKGTGSRNGLDAQWSEQGNKVSHPLLKSGGGGGNS